MLLNRFISGPPLSVGFLDRFNLPQIKGRAQFFKSYFGQD